MSQTATPGTEPKQHPPVNPKGCEPGKLDADQPIESAVVRDPEPNPTPPGLC